MMRKILIGLAVLAIVAACNKKEIKTTETERNKIENNRERGDFPDRGGPVFELDLLGDHIAYKTDSFANIFENFTEEQIQRFDLNVDEATTLVGEQGTKVIIGANNFVDVRGRAITGEVQIDFIEVFSKGDMVMLDKSTSSVSEDGESIVTLTTAGEFYISASQDGRVIHIIDPISIIVSSDDIDDDMVKFVEAGDVGDDFLWKEAEDSDIIIGLVTPPGDVSIGGGFPSFVGVAPRVYEIRILPYEWGWINLDKFTHSSCDKTSVLIEVPDGYDNTNTEVYVSFDGDPKRLANLDRWTGTHFTEHYGQFCIGTDCHFILVSNAGGSLEYVIQAATTVAEHIEVISSFTPISEEDLIDEINGLP